LPLALYPTSGMVLWRSLLASLVLVLVLNAAAAETRPRGASPGQSHVSSGRHQRLSVALHKLLRFRASVAASVTHKRTSARARVETSAEARAQAGAQIWAHLDAQAAEEGAGEGADAAKGHKIFLVPVLEPEMAKDTFNALNPTPDLPPVIAPGSKMGSRPFLAQAGIGIIPPASFVEVESQMSGADLTTPSWLSMKTEPPAGSKDCPEGFSHQPTSDGQNPCIQTPIHPVPVVPMQRRSNDIRDWKTLGYNPAFPPHVMIGAQKGLATPAFAIIPPRFQQVLEQQQ